MYDFPQVSGMRMKKCWKKKHLNLAASSKIWGSFQLYVQGHTVFPRFLHLTGLEGFKMTLRKTGKNACKSNITCQNAMSVTSGFAQGP